MSIRKIAIGAVIVGGGALLGVVPASATPVGDPSTVDACVGMVTAYGDHPEASPAFFARYFEDPPVSVQTLMQWVRDYCFSLR